MDVRVMESIRGYYREIKRRRKSVRLFMDKELGNPGNYYSENSFDYYKCIFIHIPKAAGISITKSLFGNYGAGHRNIKYWEKKLPSYTFNKYFKFAIVRNPYTRLLSAYNFLVSGGLNEFDNEYSKKLQINTSSFEDFVENYLDKNTMMEQLHFYPQVYFIQDHNELICLDYIGRFENLNESFKFISKQIKIKNTLTHDNTGQKVTNNIKDHYTKSMLQKVNTLYKDDFEALNYSMIDE